MKQQRFVSRISHLVSRAVPFAREIRFTRYASRELLALLSLVLISGCRTATRIADVPRVDLKLEGGNRGYLIGTPPAATGLKPTRQMVSTDIEIPTFYKPKRGSAKGNLESGASAAPEAEAAPSNAPVAGPQHYDTYVVKPGESLWTIAAKPEIYGKSTRWRRIFDANRDILKSPNHVRAGMTLKIPRDGGPSGGDEETTFKK